LDRGLAALCVLPLPAPSCPAVARTAFSLRRRLLWAACRLLAGGAMSNLSRVTSILLFVYACVFVRVQ